MEKQLSLNQLKGHIQEKGVEKKERRDTGRRERSTKKICYLRGPREDERKVTNESLGQAMTYAPYEKDKRKAWGWNFNIPIRRG